MTFLAAVKPLYFAIYKNWLLSNGRDENMKMNTIKAFIMSDFGQMPSFWPELTNLVALGIV